MSSSIEQRLAETIAWCGIAKRGDGVWFPPPLATKPSRLAQVFAKWWPKPSPLLPDLSSSIRSETLEPPALGSGRGGELISELHASRTTAREAVSFICERRREALSQRGITVAQRSDLGGGRVLSTNFDSDQCGAATAPSRGFFDLYDVPPWDTWFHHDYNDELTSGRVYCWVPHDLMPWAQRGLDCIPIHHMRWIEALEDLESGAGRNAPSAL
jgi:hypothetical protein